ncbi:MAG: hypothetical protein R3C44_22470 [Chloroflexota bacterium]
MTQYDLYLESGPRHKKTMVHVPQILGCMANGPTTEEALERTPDAIRAFLSFLQRNQLTNDGLPSDPTADIDVYIAEHITEGVWLGNGDPSIVFLPDLDPVSEEQIEEYIGRLDAMGREMAALVRELEPDALTAEPERGRPIAAILNHVLEAETGYMTAFGKIEGLPGPTSILARQEGDILSWTATVRGREYEKLRSLTPDQRTKAYIPQKHVRTARKVLRRVLEHQWEHLVEVQERLGDGE